MLPMSLQTCSGQTERHTPFAWLCADGDGTAAAGPLLSEFYATATEVLCIALDHCAKPRHIGLLLGLTLIVHDAEPGACKLHELVLDGVGAYALQMQLDSCCQSLLVGQQQLAVTRQWS